MRFFVTALLLLVVGSARSQELFVYSEPASNMAAGSIGFRLNNTFMKVENNNRYNYHLVPELMFGISKHLMIHLDAFLSNRNKALAAEGGAVYVKYRFYSEDEVHSHFRLAAYARASYNNSDIHQPAINLYGHNSGFETGLIATKLINKVAVSAGAAHLYAKDNGKGNKFAYGDGNRNAVAYNLSVGKLLLPKEYTDYKQTNMNLMVELLGQTNLQSGRSYLDLAPSLQLIFLSRMRLDLGYSFPLVHTLDRTASRGALVRLEYNIFNAF